MEHTGILGRVAAENRMIDKALAFVEDKALFFSAGVHHKVGGKFFQNLHAKAEGLKVPPEVGFGQGGKGLVGVHADVKGMGKLFGVGNGPEGQGADQGPESADKQVPDEIFP